MSSTWASVTSSRPALWLPGLLTAALLVGFPTAVAAKVFFSRSEALELAFPEADRVETETYILNRPDVGLLIPPSIWAEQTYRAPGSVLTVLCDRPYEAYDYIKDYSDFKIYRKTVDSDA